MTSIIFIEFYVKSKMNTPNGSYFSKKLHAARGSLNTLHDIELITCRIREKHPGMF